MFFCLDRRHAHCTAVNQLEVERSLVSGDEGHCFAIRCFTRGRSIITAMSSHLLLLLTAGVCIESVEPFTTDSS